MLLRFSRHCSSARKNRGDFFNTLVGFRNTANSVPLMYALMSFETAVRRFCLVRIQRIQRITTPHSL
jgi:hypothetical protein